MNKTELVAAIAEKTELSKKDAQKAVEAFVAVVTDALKADDSVALVGFGTFASVAKPASTSRNPRTGEPIEVPAHNSPKFKPGKALKDALN